jgi:hypothetical protein
MTETERRFAKELEVFRTECEAAAQYFFGYLAVHELARRRKSVFRLLNQNALFWNTALGALQTSAVICLGRIFDTDQRAHRLDRLLKLAKENLDLFSRDALRRRRLASAPEPPEWLDALVAAAHEATSADFKRLKPRISQHRELYRRNVAFVRHRLLAHKEDADPHEIAALLSNTRVIEIQRLIVFLLGLHEALSQLFENGCRPVVRRLPYSVARMRSLPSLAGGSFHVHERMVGEAAQVLGVTARSNKGLRS